MSSKQAEEPRASSIKTVGLILGPVVFLLLMLGTGIEGLSREGQAAAAVTLLMAIWWLTEALPIYATALVPIVVFPLTGVLSAQETTLNYGHELIFLFLGGFMLSIAVQKWNLHRRIALAIIGRVGFEPSRLVLGFMAATGFLSMWISNTAAAMMMVPIGLAVITQLASLAEARGLEVDTRPGHFQFGTALMLGIAYSASIGGLATIIGSPPNAIFVGYVERVYGVQISFVQWMLFGVPFAVIGLVGTWLMLTRVVFPLRLAAFEGIGEVIEESRRELGPMSRAEGRVLFVFGIMAGLWLLRGVLVSYLDRLGLGGFTDTTVAILGALLLFLIPAELGRGRALLDWDDTQEVPWGILLLFGGGLALASGIEQSGLAAWLGDGLGVIGEAPEMLVVLVVVVASILVTEVTSNTSSATIFVPIAAILAGAVGIHPFILMVTVVAGATCSFMLPIATPPNAVVFGSNYVTMGTMVRAGVQVNAVFVVLITLAVWYWLPVVWGL